MTQTGDHSAVVRAEIKGGIVDFPIRATLQAAAEVGIGRHTPAGHNPGQSGFLYRLGQFSQEYINSSLLEGCRQVLGTGIIKSTEFSC
jgi:hypothetical protein